MNREKTNWLDITPIPAIPWLTLEKLLFGVIVLLAIITRFYNLEPRVMSHDESLHTYYSWLLYRGQGYEHNPMMHGPLQFHMLALSYFIFGASDFTARIPAVLFGIANVWVMWYWRRYLGRWGAILAAALMVISPYMLYYSRYVRNESFVALFGTLTLFATLRYLESGRDRYLYLLSAATVLHFTVKETSFIYTAEFLIFIAALFVTRVLNKPWGDNNENQLQRSSFIISMIAMAIGIGGALAVAVINNRANSGAEAAGIPSPMDPNVVISMEVTLALIGIIALLCAGYFLLTGFHLKTLRKERSFELLMLVGSLILPMLVAFPVTMVHANPMDYSWPSMEGWVPGSPIPNIFVTLGFILLLTGLSILAGYIWNWSKWWRNALLFYAIFTVFYTTLFTNGAGFFSGLVGSLGYWLEQQGVQRGSQPWYYYIMLQVPMYEFLPFLTTIMAFIMGIWKLPQANQFIQNWINSQTPNTPEITSTPETEEKEADDEIVVPTAAEIEVTPPEDIDQLAAWNLPNTFALLGWWSLASLLAFSLAGEKMPWLTVHITLPMIMFGGWALGNLANSVYTEDMSNKKPWLVILVLSILVTSLVGLLLSLTGAARPFEGKDLNQLKATTSFIFSVIGVAGSLFGLFRLLEQWTFKQMSAMFGLLFFGLLGLQTARSAFRASYVLYDSGMEYLVYAHGYTGNKDVLKQVMELSSKTTGDPYAIVVGYDDDVSWPMSWYMRDFKNAKYYGNAPTRDLTREAPAIIVGDNNFSKIEPLVGDKFYRFDYIRMVWPNQDYFGLTWERFNNAISNPEMRSAIVQIWLNRDFTLYGQVNNSSGIKPESWDPSDRMRLYVRKDVLANIWSYGVAPTSRTENDPYQGKTLQLNATMVIGSAGQDAGQFNAPRAMAIGPDGSIYVADSRNHRIQHFSAQGQFINQWGSFGDLNAGTANDGTFNEPWGVAVGPDGSVYVSDTWNHRVQKFDANGQFQKAWGIFGLSTEGPDRLYGPRGIEVDAQGQVYVADTGNKRIVIYDSNGTYLGEFGGEGAAPGQFYEPVDVAIDAAGNAYVTDTWNQRVQVLAPSQENKFAFVPVREWPINGWLSDSLDNKPYIAIAANGNVLVTDPEGYRVLEFTSMGEIVRTWGEYGVEDYAFGLSSGIATAPDGSVWVVDAGNMRIMRFVLP